MKVDAQQTKLFKKDKIGKFSISTRYQLGYIDTRINIAITLYTWSGLYSERNNFVCE